MDNNLPNEYSATVRRGATFGPVTFTFSDIDLTGYTLTSGVGAADLPATVVKNNSTQVTFTLPAALTAQLAYSVGPGFRQGRNAWWLDATASDGTVVPLLGGVIEVLTRGNHD
jgi:hypothetical protein